MYGEMIGLRGWFAEEAGEMEGEILGDCRTLEWVTAGAGVRSHKRPYTRSRRAGEQGMFWCGEQIKS